MKSLSQLNTFSNIQVSVTDSRPASVTTALVGSVSTIQEDDLTEFPLVNAYEIYSIINPSVANVRYRVTLSSELATITWNTDPRFTVSKVGAVYTVSGINSTLDWEMIKNPTVNLPIDFPGVLTYTVSIIYNTATQNNITVSWDVSKRVVVSKMTAVSTIAAAPNRIRRSRISLSPVCAMSVSGNLATLTQPQTTVLFSSQTSNPFGPSVFETNDTVGATWTLIMVTNPTNVSNITAPGYSAYTSYNSSTATLTITADITNLNGALAALRVTTTAATNNFNIAYELSNDLTADVYDVVQSVINGNSLTYPLTVQASIDALGGELKDFSCSMTAVSAQTAEANKLKGSFANISAVSQLSGDGFVAVENAIKLIYEVPAGDAGARSITLPLGDSGFMVPTEEANVTVYWGDGTSQNITSPAAYSKTYATGGTYRVVIYGSKLTNFGYLNNSVVSMSQQEKLKKVLTLGNIPGMVRMTWAFSKANNLESVPTQIPSTVKNVRGLFSFSSAALDRNIEQWNTGNIEDMSVMFWYNTGFNRRIGNWNTKNVTDMSYMFDSSTKFNQDLRGWCVSNLTIEPDGFATNSILASGNRPIWGTCPTGSRIFADFDVATSANRLRPTVVVTTGPGAIRNTSVYRFGVSSLGFTTNDNFAVNAGTDIFSLGTGDFTIEGWVRLTEDFSSTDTTVWNFMQSSTDATNMRLSVPGATNRFVFRAGGANRITSDADWALNTWYHIAIVRNSGVTRMYINGVSQSTTYTDTNNYPARVMNLGRVGYVSQRLLPGLIDELRISKVARYTANFTAPTSAFTNDTNTLMLLHMDSTGLPDDSIL